jgi:hypothetical protein
MRNSGIRNSGMRNSGMRNSGMRNSGMRNSGMRNSGMRNSGMRGVLRYARRVCGVALWYHTQEMASRAAVVAYSGNGVAAAHPVGGGVIVVVI